MAERTQVRSSRRHIRYSHVTFHLFLLYTTISTHIIASNRRILSATMCTANKPYQPSSSLSGPFPEHIPKLIHRGRHKSDNSLEWLVSAPDLVPMGNTPSVKDGSLTGLSGALGCDLVGTNFLVKWNSFAVDTLSSRVRADSSFGRSSVSSSLIWAERIWMILRRSGSYVGSVALRFWKSFNNALSWRV